MAGVRLAEFLRDALELPEVELRGEELLVHGKPFCYVSTDGDSVRLKALLQEQAALIEHDPATYSAAAETSGRYGWVSIRLARVRRDELAELLDEAWSHSAPKKLIVARRKARG